jgi:TP901 family phage tail tape measure protein
MRASVSGIEKVGAGMANAGAAMTAGLTLPIAGLGVAATKIAMDFQAGMANVATLIDTNTESVDAMGASILEMSRRVPVGISDLTASLYDVRSAGVSAADQFKVLEASAKLGVAGIGTTKQANDLLTSSLNAFGISASDAGSAANAIFTTVKSGKTTIEGLAQGFGAVAPAISAAGIKLDDYLSNVAAMTAVGTPAATVYTQLKAVVSGLTRETTKSRKVFGALGAKDFPDLVAKSGGLQAALTKIKGELGGDTAKMLELVGSTDALTAMLALTGTQAGMSQAALADMRSGVDNLGPAFQKQSATGAAAMQRSKNAIEASAISIGTKLLPVVERMAKIAEDAAGWFESLGEDGQNSALMLAAAFAIAGPAMTAVGGAITVIGGLAKAWQSVTAAIAIYQAATGAGFVASIWGIASAWFGVAAGVIAATWPFLALAAAIGAAVAAWSSWKNLQETEAQVAEKKAQLGATNDALAELKALQARDAHLFPGGAPVTGGNTGAAATVLPAATQPGSIQAMAAQIASQTWITVDFSGMPPGVNVTSQTTGPVQVQTNVGRAGSSL